MAALASCLLLSASCAALIGASPTLPVGFPCVGANATTILSSVLTTSWPGACLGLKDVSSGTATQTAASCKAICIADPTCSVWQLGPAPNKYCYISDETHTALNCWGRDEVAGSSTPKYAPTAAERLQHGFINVTKVLKAGTYIAGLKAIGDMKSSTDPVGVARCKAQCYSIVACKNWFYVTGKSTVTGNSTVAAVASKPKGCFLQTLSSQLGAESTLPVGQTSVGEEISHTCAKPTIPGVIGSTKEPSNLWWILLLVAIIVILIIVALVVIFVFCQNKEKPKKTRAVKVAPKKEPQVIQPLVRMPVVQQPMVQYAAPTVTRAMVTPTYQAVPQAAPAVYASAPMFQSVVVEPTVMQPMLM